MPCAPTQDLRISGHCWRTSFKMLPSPVEILFCFVVTYWLSQELAVFVVSHCQHWELPDFSCLTPYLSCSQAPKIHGFTGSHRQKKTYIIYIIIISLSLYLYIYIHAHTYSLGQSASPALKSMERQLVQVNGQTGREEASMKLALPFLSTGLCLLALFHILYLGSPSETHGGTIA